MYDPGLYQEHVNERRRMQAHINRTTWMRSRPPRSSPRRQLARMLIALGTFIAASSTQSPNEAGSVRREASGSV